MSPSPTNGSPHTAEVAGAGAAGGGIGVVLASLANGMNESSQWKAPLTVAAPLVAVALSGLWLFVKSMYIDPFVSKKKRESDVAELTLLLQQAEETRDRVRADPLASSSHKAKVEADVEELETQLLQRYKDQSLRIVQRAW